MAARPGRTLLATSPLRSSRDTGADGLAGGGMHYAPVPPPRPPSSDRPHSGRPASSGPRESGLSDRIAALQEATETTTKRIEMERRKSEELAKKIEISRKKLEESRTRMRGMDDTSEVRSRTKAVKTAEHRLDVLMSKLNQINKQNEGMRAAIESLRRDKIQRQRIVRRLEREVSEAKKHLEQSTADAATAAEARDKADREIAALQATIQREAAQFEVEFTSRIEQSTQRAAERREADKETLAVAAAADSSASQAALLSKAPVHGALGGIGAEEQVGSMTVEQEIELKHKSIRTWWEIARREVEVKQQSAKLAHLEEAFAKIQEETGIQTIDEMVSAFVQTEDRNYSVLMMINDLNQEIETAEVENAALRAAVEEARTKGTAGQAMRDGLYKDWDTQIKTLHKRAVAYDRQFEHAMRSLDAIKPGVHSIFQKLGTESAVAESLSAAGVTDTNIMQHLGLIEQRVSELMHLYEMSASGIPLTLPTEEEEAFMASGSAAPSEAGSARAGSPKLAFDVEISRVGGLGAAEGNFRSRRAVVAAPVPPSLADLEESSEEEDFLPSSAGMTGTRRLSQTRSRRASGGVGGKPTADQADADLTEPLDLDQLRKLTTQLVERKQAKAERRERTAEAAKLAAMDASASVAAGATLTASLYGRTPQRGGAASVSGAASTQHRSGLGSASARRPASRASATSAGSSPIRTPRRRGDSIAEEKKELSADASSARPHSSASAASVPAGEIEGEDDFNGGQPVPRPPAQPSGASGRPATLRGSAQVGRRA